MCKENTNIIMSIQEFENAFISSKVKMRIQEFERAFYAQDTEALFSFSPPKLVQTIAKKFGVKPEDFMALLKEKTENLYASVEMISYDLDLKKAIISKTPSGRIYSIIPTKTVMRFEESKISATAQTLAFVDEGIWYIVSLTEDEGIQFLKEAYPEFKGVAFKKATIEIIEE